MIWSGYRTLKKESLLAINGLEMGAIACTIGGIESEALARRFANAYVGRLYAIALAIELIADDLPIDESE